LGQNHSRWCSASNSEEDIDWEIVPVPNKGLGVIAKKFIAKSTRIMIDPIRDIIFPAVRDLCPIGSTILEKDRLNSFGSCGGSSSMLFVRVARMNHDCDSNASQGLEQGTRVMVVVSNRDILPGEEICINYTNYNGRSGPRSVSDARETLKSKWDIVCSPDTCACARMADMLDQCRHIDQEISEMVKERNPSSDALDKVDSLLQLLDTANATWTWKQHTYWMGFKIAIMRPETLGRAFKYGERAKEIHGRIFHPESDRTKEIEFTIQNPKSHKCFLIKVAAQSA